MSKQFYTVVALLYFIAANLTGGYYYNHRCNDTYFCGLEAAYSGMLWPIYWPARAGLAVTK